MSKDDLWSKGFGTQTRMCPEATLDDYWAAPGGDVNVGGLSVQWQDKPHRLLYDLIGEILHLRKDLADAEAKIQRLEKRASDLSWQANPDRSGGAYTDEEICRATDWR